MRARRTILLAVLAVAVAFVVSPPPSLVLGPWRAAGELEPFEQLETRLMTAIQQHDRKTLDDLLADDYEVTSAEVSGKRLGKVAYVRVAVERQERIADFRLGKLSTTNFGTDVVLVQAELEWTVASDLGDEVHRVFLTDIWRFKKGRWQLVNRHSTPAQ